MKIDPIVITTLGKADATVAALKNCRASIDLAQFQEVVDKAERVRAGLLLTAGAEKQLDAADVNRNMAIRERDRAKAAIDALEERIETAVIAEKEAVLDTLVATINWQADDLAARCKEIIPKRQAEIVALLKELEALEAEVARANETLAQAGRPTMIAPVETRAFPVSRALYAPTYSILERTRFRRLDDAPEWKDPATDYIDFT